MNNESSIETTDNAPQVLDLNTYREFLSRISGVIPIPVDTDDEIADNMGDESPSESTNLIPASFISYQCFTKAVNPDNLDNALNGFTPDDIFEPENVFVTGMIDATSPEFTKFSFAFDTESEEGQKSYEMMKRALQCFDNARMDIDTINVNEYIPFFFCNITSMDTSITCNFCNPLLFKYQREIIEVIVPTSLVSFEAE